LTSSNPKKKKENLLIYLEHLSPTNLTAYVVNAQTLSLTWDLPSNVNEIDKIYITIIELSQTNRTIQRQSFDNSIKKLDISINDNDPYSIHSNTTVYFSAQSSDRHGQNSSIIDYQLYINILSKFFSNKLFFSSDVDRLTSCCKKHKHTHFNKYLLLIYMEERKKNRGIINRHRKQKKKENAEGLFVFCLFNKILY
jgi:hypothetical protein